jgi:tetratricopeptide (TPR) repeat protein
MRISRRRTRSLSISALPLVILSLVPAVAQAETIPGLGTAAFPTSTHSAAAQHAFIRGLLLLHVFEYGDAARAFEEAEKIDPTFAMAYWGEAMTFNHPVWNELDTAAGQVALAKFGPAPDARAARIADPREHAYMAALEILFSGRGTKRARDAAYATAMRQLSEAYPTDDEAQLFYSLALLGESEGVRDVPTYLKAAEIAKAVFSRNSDHPGAAHYWIHGMDDPDHAAGALAAARALSKIAPDAGHAQHMCSHIFLALGMWDDVVQANIAATGVVNRQAAAASRPPRRCGHYNDWLQYGYLEQGRLDDATRIATGCRAESTAPGMIARASGAVDPDSASVASFVVMRTRDIVDGRGGRGDLATSTLELSGALMPEFNQTIGTGFAAALAGDLVHAHEALSRVEEMLPNLPALFDKTKLPSDDPQRTVPGIQRLELRAMVLAAESSLDQAVTVMGQAVAMGKNLPYAFGPPSPEKPSDELLGELLLKAGKPAQARVAFEASLARAPRRTASLLGLARAANAMGDKAAAKRNYGELLQIWQHADSGYAPKEEATKFLSAADGRRPADRY